MRSFKVSFTFILAIVLYLLSSNQTLAAVNCTTQYGGGQTCVSIGQLLVSKTVLNPDNNQFVDNLGLSNHHFAPGEQITFQIVVQNTGDNSLNNINVSDTLPAFVTLSSGQLSYTISQLNAGQSDTKQIKATVVSAGSLPAKQNVICESNLVNAGTSDQSSSDTSQFCIEKKVLGITTFPPTGPKFSEVIIFTSIVLAFLGAFLVKKSYGK